MEPRQTLAQFDDGWRRERGAELIGGVDEAGRGALAGPVVAACVVLAPGSELPGVNDSKQLTPEQREALVPEILTRATAWGVGWASAAEIDTINILQATLRAAGRALELLGSAPQMLLTDYLKLPAPPCPYVALTKGDARSQSIAAASVLAKVARDRIMVALAAEYPPYGFAGHKGYGAPIHRAALAAHGASTLHRLTFGGVLPEPFFGAENEAPRPLLRCLSHPHCGGRLAAPPPHPDWLELLTAAPAGLDPTAFLPALEWELGPPAPPALSAPVPPEARAGN